MGRGGIRAGAGRPKGRKNKATVEEKLTLSELAKHFAPDALAALHRIATTGQSEAAVVSASTAILDRAYGRPRQIDLSEEKEDGLTLLLRDISKRGSCAPIAQRDKRYTT